MKDIKFRAWDEGNKKMHTDVQFITSGNENNDWILFASAEQHYKVDGNKVVFDNPYFRQQIKLMQFTGLLDKNKKPIYEGDIIAHSAATERLTIVFERGAFYIDENIDETEYLLGELKEGNIEVIGNIYETPSP